MSAWTAVVAETSDPDQMKVLIDNALPIAGLFVLVLGVAMYFLWRSLNKQVKRIDPSLPAGEHDKEQELDRALGERDELRRKLMQAQEAERLRLARQDERGGKHRLAEFAQERQRHRVNADVGGGIHERPAGAMPEARQQRPEPTLPFRRRVRAPS